MRYIYLEWGLSDGRGLSWHEWGGTTPPHIPQYPTEQGRHPRFSADWQIGEQGRLPQKGHFIMEITGIKNIHPSASKASSKKGWKLTDSLREKITALAREDAAQGVYMGNLFLALRKSEVAKVAPDRAALMGKVSQRMADMGNMKQIEEADRRWLCLLFGEPYEARFQSGGAAAHVYDGNGDEVLTYTAGVGWHEKESRAETEVHGALKAAYYGAYHAARQEINAGEIGRASCRERV